MKKLLICGLIVLVIAGIGLAVVRRMDVSAYRPALAHFLSEKTGRDVAILGSLKLGASWHEGFYLAVKDVRVANPAWAERQHLATVARLLFHFNPEALVQGNILIDRLVLEGADVGVEMNAKGVLNIEEVRAEDVLLSSAKAEAEDVQKKLPQLNLRIVRVDSFGSHIAWRQGKGEARLIGVDKLMLAAGDETRLFLEGSLDNAPLQLVVKGQKIEEFFGPSWRFATEVLYNGIHLTAEGTSELSNHSVMINTFAFAQGESQAEGYVHIRYGTQRPAIEGKVVSTQIALSDLFQGAEEMGASRLQVEDQHPFVFSFRPFDQSVLKKWDIKLDVEAKEFLFGVSRAHDVRFQVNLANGLLLISPLSMKFGDSEAKGQMRLDMSGRVAAFDLLVKAYRLAFSDVVQLGGAESVLDGKADLDLMLSATGESPHDLAANMNGWTNLMMANGALSPSALRDLTGFALDTFLAPGAGLLTQQTVSCMVARFNVVNGVIKPTAVVLDTAVSTFVLSGYADLRTEVLNFVLTPKSSSSIMPAARIMGTLANPQVKMMAGNFLKNAIGALVDKGMSLLSGNVGSAQTSSGCGGDLNTVSSNVITPSMLDGLTGGSTEGLMDGLMSKLKGMFGGGGSDILQDFTQ